MRPSKKQVLPKLERVFSENELPEFIQTQIAPFLKSGDVILLEGEMGAGKSTFARYLLKVVGCGEQGGASPTFAICHEYEVSGGAQKSPRGIDLEVKPQDKLEAPVRRVAHLDFYRLRVEEELEESGINELIWGGRVLALVEWADLFPAWRERVQQTRRGARVQLKFVDDPTQRLIALSWFEPAAPDSGRRDP